MKKLIFIGYMGLLALTCKAQDKYDSALTPVLSNGWPSVQLMDSLSKADSLKHDSTVKVIVTAKVDSAVAVSAPSDTKVGPIKLPTWLLSFIAAIITLLPAIQIILKRIPTANSIKIQGWLGIILDALTWFQKDKSTAVSSSAPPPVQNGIEKPALRDLQNHK